MEPHEQLTVKKFIARLCQKYQQELLAVWLFGSKARGDADSESDIDLLVIVRDLNYWQYWHEITDLTTQLLLETGVNISALVCPKSRYQWWATHHAPIYNNIQREGVELWTTANVPSLLSA